METNAQQQTTAILSRIREVCEDKSQFRKPNDGECICLDLWDLHPHHLLRAIDRVRAHCFLSAITIEIKARRFDFDLTKTVEENLLQNDELREFIYELICK